MDGLLLVDKPSGWTSFDVVARIRGLIRTAGNQSGQITDDGQQRLSRKLKVGHTGTLDPLATGLLVLVIGDYCKRAQEFSKLDKTYEVTMRLGVTSKTGDEEGEKASISDRQPSYEEVEDALKRFIGEGMQAPPAFSAVKVGGERAYKLARAGQEVKLEPRPVTIYSVELTDYSYPDVKFTAEVSSGTYVRSLAEDIGKVLMTGAYMSDLRRTKVGDWQIATALSMDDVSIEAITQNLIVL